MTTPDAALAEPAGATGTEPKHTPGGLDIWPPPDALGSVDRYRLIETIGKGGMGTVFRARDPDLNREIAIKLLDRLETASGASSVRSRMLREAQAMAKLTHPNLAIVHDVGSDDGRVFIAMEFIEGSDLRDRFDGTANWRTRLAWVVQAARGLAAAHAGGVVHRDFKPANVLVAESGQVKVVDFGLARGTGDGLDPNLRPPTDDVLDTDMTVTGAIMGTPMYMAPEQHRGERATEAADQFSLGVVAYEAAYGERPYTGKTLLELAEKSAAGPAAAPSSDVPSAVFVAISRALAPDPNDRFPSVAEFADAIEEVLRPPSRRWLAIGGSLVAVAAVCFFIYFVTRPEPEARGHLAREKIHATVAANQPDALKCWHEELARNPDIQRARVNVRFFIEADGRVRRTTIDESPTASPELETCIGQAAFGWRFPEPVGGPVQVTYPLVFTQGPKAPQ